MGSIQKEKRERERRERERREYERRERERIEREEYERREREREAELERKRKERERRERERRERERIEWERKERERREREERERQFKIEEEKTRKIELKIKNLRKNIQLFKSNFEKYYYNDKESYKEYFEELQDLLGIVENRRPNWNINYPYNEKKEIHKKSINYEIKNFKKFLYENIYQII